MSDSQATCRQVLESRKVLKEILGHKYPSAAETEEETGAAKELYGRDEYDFRDVDIDLEPEDLPDPEDYSFSVKHHDIPEWNLHIVYLKFPEEGDSSKVNITRAYIEGEVEGIYELNNKEDNIMIILPLNTSTAPATYINYVDNVNMTTDKPDGKSELAKKILENENYTLRHMNNVQIFHINALTINILKHEMVPKHETIRNEDEIENILKEHNCSNKTQFPVIQKHDAIAEILGLVPGDMVKIHRPSIASGKSIFYRICK